MIHIARSREKERTQKSIVHITFCKISNLHIRLNTSPLQNAKVMAREKRLTVFCEIHAKLWNHTVACWQLIFMVDYPRACVIVTCFSLAFENQSKLFMADYPWTCITFTCCSCAYESLWCCLYSCSSDSEPKHAILILKDWFFKNRSIWEFRTFVTSSSWAWIEWLVLILMWRLHRIENWIEGQSSKAAPICALTVVHLFILWLTH